MIRGSIGAGKPTAKVYDLFGAVFRKVEDFQDSRLFVITLRELHTNPGRGHFGARINCDGLSDIRKAFDQMSYTHLNAGKGQPAA